MATKNNLLYVCSECGYQSKKWSGKCPDCNSWNTMFEETVIEQTIKIKSNNIKSRLRKPIELQKLTSIDVKQEKRINTGFKELNCVLGGGLVKGSVTLISGSPGIGKSTLLLQVAQFISKYTSVFYFSGEESEKQIKLRANRLNVVNDDIYIISENDVIDIVDLIETSKPGLVIIDSIQTMKNIEINSSVGSVTQVKEITNLLMNTAKKTNIPIIIVGHINKDGGIAGPKVLEHIVDTILYFECEQYNSYKILRATKNRFGATNEIGIFDMQSNGLVEVANPSIALLEGKSKNIPGTAIVCIMEGSRPIFVEVQALIAKSDFAVPRRVSTGFDYNRTCFILAVLEKKCGYSFCKLDVYVNVVGGVKINNPSADLSVALAIISSLKDSLLFQDAVIIGEVGLTGEIRPVSFVSACVNECIKLGFKKCILPLGSIKTLKNDIDLEKVSKLIEIIPVKFIWECFK